MANEPSDPFTSLGEGAAQLHEFYVSLRAAGFTRHEALYMLAQMLVLSKES